MSDVYFLKKTTKTRGAAQKNLRTNESSGQNYTTNSGQTHVTEAMSCVLMAVAVGCSDIIPPPNVWWKRSDDGANSTFGCTAKLLRVHQMSCVGNQWHSDTTPDSIDCPDSPRIGISRTELNAFSSPSVRPTLF